MFLIQLPVLIVPDCSDAAQGDRGEPGLPGDPGPPGLKVRLWCIEDFLLWWSIGKMLFGLLSLLLQFYCSPCDNNNFVTYEICYLLNSGCVMWGMLFQCITLLKFMLCRGQGEVWTNESWIFCGRWRVIPLSWHWSGVCSTTEAPKQRRVATSLSELCLLSAMAVPASQLM